MYIKVKVISGARKEIIEKESIDHYTISVREKAERNMANERVCEIIAHELSVGRGAVRIINGHHSPSKLLSINIEE